MRKRNLLECFEARAIVLATLAMFAVTKRARDSKQTRALLSRASAGFQTVDDSDTWFSKRKRT